MVDSSQRIIPWRPMGAQTRGRTSPALPVQVRASGQRRLGQLTVELDSSLVL
jgi:hypothetical protein